MLKKILPFLLLAITFNSLKAQYNNENNDDEVITYNNPQMRTDSSNLKLNRYFIGGNLLAGFGSGGGAFGLNPSIGYSVSPYVDIGLGINASYNYQSFYGGSKLRTWNYGVAPFVRVYPVNFLFFEGSFEENLISSRTINEDGSKNPRQNFSAPSLITSIGYGTHVFGQMSYFVSVGVDLLNNINSPYRDHYYDNNGVLRSSSLPIIRTGFSFNLW